MNEFEDHAPAFREQLRHAIETDPQVLLEHHGGYIPDAHIWFMDILGPGDVVIREMTTTRRPLDEYYIAFQADRADMVNWLNEGPDFKPTTMHRVERLTCKVQTGYATLKISPMACLPPRDVETDADHTYTVALIRYRPDL